MAVAQVNTSNSAADKAPTTPLIETATSVTKSPTLPSPIDVSSRDLSKLQRSITESEALDADTPGGTPDWSTWKAAYETDKHEISVVDSKDGQRVCLIMISSVGIGYTCNPRKWVATGKISLVNQPPDGSSVLVGLQPDGVKSITSNGRDVAVVNNVYTLDNYVEDRDKVESVTLTSGEQVSLEG